MSAVKLAHPCDGYLTNVFTDTSEAHWSSITNQVLTEDSSIPLREQRHEPRAFLSGEFKDANFSWSTAEEAFRIVQTFERPDYVLTGKATELHTGRRKLTYTFDPYRSNPSVSRHAARMPMRWVCKMCAFRYVSVTCASLVFWLSTGTRRFKLGDFVAEPYGILPLPLRTPGGIVS
jgi:RNase H-like domain found in reverse transcriptase